LATKNTNRIVGPKIQHHFDVHVEANRRADEWAEKSLIYRRAGKRLEAERAEQKARHWLRKAIALKARVAAPLRTDGSA
jgi:hypothetical protein